VQQAPATLPAAGWIVVGLWLAAFFLLLIAEVGGMVWKLMR
jgi:hypothetical protein